jgi:hypothetical protein
MVSPQSNNISFKTYFVIYILFIHISTFTASFFERSPTSFLSFPTEPSPSADIIDELELGELTKRGMWQEFRLGQWLGNEYGQ